MARYEAGETLSSIARTYDCSPPAISYIVSRSRAKPTSEISAPPTTEPQLVKSHANGDGPDGSAPVEPTVVPPEPIAAIRRETVAEPRPAAPANGDQRRTLHLSLGNGNGNGATNGNGNGSHPPGNGNGHSHEPSPRPGFAAPRPPQAQGAGERIGKHPFEGPPRGPAPFDPGRNGRDHFAMPEGTPAAQQPRETEATRKDNGAFIDQQLRSRVDGDIAAFLAAFDAALAEDTQESRFGLREATDRLLRAGARTRIELERLEARVPLPPREGRAAADPGAWRHR
jgi:hypothetical protein